MGKYSQAGRALSVSTSLPADSLLLEKISGDEALSELFHLQLEMLAEKGTAVPFGELLGRPLTVTIRRRDGSEARHFHGIVSRLSQGPQVRGVQQDTFIRYQAEVVPALWMLTKNVQSRIFQGLSVPAILSQVLRDQWQIDVRFHIQGDYHPRDYCVQYRETDFAFVSRLMEEEGIYYFFEHRADGHTLVVANTPSFHPLLPQPSTVPYQEDTTKRAQANQVYQWVKSQEVRAGKLTLWDHHFELPHDHLSTQESVHGRQVPVGRVRHPLEVGGNQRFELYDYPGGYAQRFDGIGRGGDDRTDDLKKIFEDNRRTSAIRLEEETWQGLTIAGAGSCWHFVSGYRFTLTGHYDADGTYLLTRVTHEASIAGSYTSGNADTPLVYSNSFQCIPQELPFRPLRRTPKPPFEGTQTALVVGPDDEEVYCDKYGRVKVQFPWDRQGQYNADSSCWVRVSQPSAGGGWGALMLPRIGHEVIVSYLDGDPDRPIIVGSVYNAREMPPFNLPEERTRSGFKSNTVNRHNATNFNGLAFEDTRGKEHVQLHAERDLMVNAENNHVVNVGNHMHTNVHFCDLLTVGGLPVPPSRSNGHQEPPPTGKPVEPPHPHHPKPAPGPHHPHQPPSHHPHPPSSHHPHPHHEPPPHHEPVPTPHTAPPTYQSFFNWKLGDQQALFGIKLQTVFGIKSDSEVGIKSDIVLGERFDLTINPLGLASLLHIPLAPALTPLMRGLLQGFGGKVDVVYGMKTDGVYGHKLTIHHGSSVNVKNSMTRMTKFLCALPPLFTGASVILYGALDPSGRVSVATASSCGGVGGLLLNALLASEYFTWGAPGTDPKGVKDPKTLLFKKLQLASVDEDRAIKAGEVGAFFELAFLKAVKKKGGTLFEALQKRAGDVRDWARNLGKGDGIEEMDDVSITEGSHLIAARHIQLIGRPSVADPIVAAADVGPSTIDINAMGDGKDGALFLNGTGGACLTSGPAVIALENAAEEKGVITVDCGLAGTVLVRRGVAAQQKIEMTPDVITIECPGEIILKAGAGMSTIKMGPTGITIAGLNISEVARVKHDLQALVHKVQAQLITSTSMLHKIQ
jgi:type VI secretion system secreted protein VgrG